MLIEILLTILIVIKLFTNKKKCYIILKNNDIKNNDIQNNNHYLNKIKFEFIGNLYNKQKNIILQLYGRERIKDRWDYYIIFNNNQLPTKIDLNNLNKRIENLETIYIEMFDTEFILYKNEMKYNYYPYIL